jgi:hypothetical protein
MDSAASDPACLPRIECGTSIDELATKLINLCSGNHSVTMVYTSSSRHKITMKNPPERSL